MPPMCRGGFDRAERLSVAVTSRARPDFRVRGLGRKRQLPEALELEDAAGELLHFMHLHSLHTLHHFTRTTHVLHALHALHALHTITYVTYIYIHYTSLHELHALHTVTCIYMHYIRLQAGWLRADISYDKGDRLLEVATNVREKQWRKSW